MFRNTQRHVTSSYFYSINCSAIVNSVTADGCVYIAESVGSRRELVPNSCTHRRRDATRQFRRVGVGGVYWALVVTRWSWSTGNCLQAGTISRYVKADTEVNSSYIPLGLVNRVPAFTCVGCTWRPIALRCVHQELYSASYLAFVWLICCLFTHASVLAALCCHSNYL